ncbi:MAG: hypothetical protein QME96_00275 [Myxococcota bacterium]|nr:hypothetical protein [Myxococcota bacterium]
MNGVKSVLPAWVVDDRESVREEAAPYRLMTPEQRGALMAAACKAAARLLGVREDRRRVLAFRDPMPQSTLLALDRLRREAAARRRPDATDGVA